MDSYEDYEFESAEDLVDNGWANEEFQDTLLYVRDELLGSLTASSNYEKVPGRPCDKMTGTLYHRPYHVYRYRDHTLFVPVGIDGNFQGAIDFGANDYGMHYHVISKNDDTLEGSFYTFTFDPENENQVHFHKQFIQCTVDDETYKKELQNAGSEEIFFTGKRYVSLFEKDPNTVRKSVDIVRTPRETNAYAEDSTDIKASIDRLLDGEREYIPVDQMSPLFELADSFDILNIK